MAISSETVGRLLASGRNYAGQIIAFAGGIGVMSAAQQKTLSEGLGQVVDGIMMVIHGGATMWTVLAVVAAPIVGPILARWASNTAKTSNQAAAVKTAVDDPNTVVSPETKVVIASAAASAVADPTTPTPPEAKAAIAQAAAAIKP